MYGLGVLLELLVSARINFLEIYRYKARASLEATRMPFNHNLVLV